MRFPRLLSFLRLASLAWLLTSMAAPVRADEIDRYLRQERAIHGIPAVVVGVMRDGRLVDQRAAGLVNVELQVKATPRHGFEIGSISKQFTAYAILMLREQGKLQLDSPLARFMPDLPDAWGRVTLHRLLTHTSGLPDLEEAFGYGIYRETPTDAEFLKRLLALPTDFAPGEQFRYSNTNYWLLGLVIERISGQPYAEFMQQRIFKPLGMGSTRSALPATLLPGRAAGYRNVGPVLENRDAIQPHTGRGLADLSSTLADLLRWEREQLAPRLVSAETAALARRPVQLNDGTTEPYAYGWNTEPILKLASLQHDGQTAGFTATYIRVPERRLAVVVLANVYGAPTDALAKFVLKQVEPALREPRPRAMADEQPALTAQVRRMIETGAQASTQWREDWFGAEQWRTISSWLTEIDDQYRRIGPLRRLTLVGREPQDDGALRLSYRAEHARVSRILNVRIDAQGRIGGSDAVDE